MRHANHIIGTNCSLMVPSVAQLYGNPLEVLPELSPCASLRHISLANTRISADEDFEHWTVEVHSDTRPSVP
jgi:hypothetical protein